ncbi:MAG: sugar phosphate isomerase/epimerase [Planctomycetes bacterium]|nr:sugar phosphate isomerase/epimerase [Planctomycetota bacterium]
MKIGVCLSSLKLPLRQGLPAVARMNVKGVQLDAYGDLSPERLSDTGRRELRNLLKTYDLELTALNCPLRLGIDAAENQEARIEHIKRVMDLAFELGPRLVIVQFPKIAEEPVSPRAMLMREALLALGLYGDRMGTSLALEIGFDAGDKVRDYLKTFEVGCLGVNYDPVNLILHGHDATKNLFSLTGMVRHVNARDARVMTVNLSAAEVPLGAGDIEWLGFVGTLTAIEYRGAVVVRRDTGSNQLEDVTAGVKFLRRMVI